MKLDDMVGTGSQLSYLRLAARNLWPVKVESEDFYVLRSMKYLRILMERNSVGQESVLGLDRWVKKLEKYDYGKDLSKSDGKDLEEMIAIWRDRLESELGKTPVVRLDKSMTLNFELLQDGAKGFFSEDVWRELPEMSKADLNEAARCLLCGIPTASAMIGLRATEDVLREYYKRKTRRVARQKGWKQIINELLTKDKSGDLKYSVNKSLMGHLDFVRVNRNMAEHPDKVFTKRSAENLFSQVVITITEMCEDMGRKKSGRSGSG